MKLTQKEYREIFTKLPKEIQEVCTSSETTDHLYQIAEKHRLHIDEAGIVHDIVMDVIMGVLPAKSMLTEIIKEVHLAPLVASALLRDIDEEILAPIKDVMVDVYKESNPFKPKTLKYADEYDEDDIHLQKESLLHEIENPVSSVARKEQTIPTIKQTPKQKVEEVVETKKEIVEPQIPDIMKQKRDKLLTKITDAKLSNIVRMTDHMQDSALQENQGLINPVETPNLYKTIQEEQKNTPIEKKLVDPFRSTLVSKNATTLPLEQKDSSPAKEAVEIPSTPTKPVDPYRESI